MRPIREFMGQRRPVIYRLYDSKRRLLYVGKTSEPVQNRLFQHWQDKPWWRHVAYASVQRFRTEAEALEAETRAILRERPKYNVAGMPRMPQQGLSSAELWDAQMQVMGWGRCERCNADLEDAERDDATLDGLCLNCYQEAPVA